MAWMAGLFYLPRLFVYHVEASNQEMRDTFCVMERRLFKIIMQPAMHFALALGIILAMLPGTWSAPWFHLKLTAIIILISYHYFLNKCRKDLLNGCCQRSSRFFRIINEIPSVILIIILIAVYVRPF
jgi:putative membrane protein